MCVCVCVCVSYVVSCGYDKSANEGTVTFSVKFGAISPST